MKDVYIAYNAAITMVNLPNLTSVGGLFFCGFDDLLQSVMVPQLMMTGAQFDMQANQLLTLVQAPALAYTGAYFQVLALHSAINLTHDFGSPLSLTITPTLILHSHPRADNIKIPFPCLFLCT